MSRFTSHLGLRLRETPDGRPITRDGRCTWEVLDPALVYEVGVEGSGVRIVVPGGSVTDLASPWPARGLLPPDGPWVKAAVVHDYLYLNRGVAGDVRYSREASDDILAEAMEVLGVPSWKRWVIYKAVRLGGKKGWGS